MMGPINTNPQFDHDYQKYVLQDPNTRVVPFGIKKPFDISAPEKSEKTKKDLKKKDKKEP